MSNRFHNKLHRQNHHSQRTPKNDTYTDASYDPIASYEAPFQGEFYSDGEIVTHTYLSADEAIYTTDANISNNLTVSNNLSVGNDLLVKGNFTVLGSTSQIDTLVYVTSAMSITNVGTGPALLVNQTGNNIVADFRDEGVSSLFIDGRTATAGFIGINTNSPNERLTIVGNISARGNLIVTQNVYVSGNEIVQGDLEVRGGDLTTNQSTFNLINANASTVNFAGAGTSVNVGSSSGFTNINNNLNVSNVLSANGDGIFTKNLYLSGSFKSLSANVTQLLAVPVGTTTERVSAQGAIRYNTTDQTFEGYDGAEWGPIGGGSLVDIDEDTYITVDSNPPTNINEITFYTAGSARAIINSSGNIGVGTILPTDFIHLSTDRPFGTVLNIQNSSAGGRPWQLYSTGSSNAEGAGKFLLRDESASQIRLAVDTNGNVGIGERSPQQKLTVNGSISASNTVHISAVEFTGITTTATSITADNLFIQVNVGGVQKYLRLFDIE